MKFRRLAKREGICAREGCENPLTKKQKKYCCNKHRLADLNETPLSEETRRKISLSMSGEKNPNFRKRHSDKTKREISEAKVKNWSDSNSVYNSEIFRKKMSENTKGERNPNYGKVGAMLGKSLSPEQRAKVSRAKKGKTYGPNFKERVRQQIKDMWDNPNSKFNTKETREKFSLANKRRWQDPKFVGHSLEWKERIRQTHLKLRQDPNSKFNSDEYKKQIRQTVSQLWADPNSIYNTPEYREKLGQAMRKVIIKKWADPNSIYNSINHLLKLKIVPSYNKKACEYFKKFEGYFKTKGEYATTTGERRVPEANAYLDYFNKELKIIIEWDEEHHYLANGSLRPEDIKRQKLIQAAYPGFLFIRIREKNFLRQFNLESSTLNPVASV